MANENRSRCDLVINNARVFDGEKLRDGLLSVGIAGNKISFVEKATRPAAKEIDAAGKFLMPGLIDCHLHLLNMWTAVDEASMEADLNGALKTRLDALLAAGVTTVKSVGDSDEEILACAISSPAAKWRVRGSIPPAPDFAHPAVIPRPPFTPGIRGSGAAPLSKPILLRMQEKRCDVRLSVKSTPSKSFIKADVNTVIRTAWKSPRSISTFKLFASIGGYWKRLSTRGISTGSKSPSIPSMKPPPSRRWKRALTDSSMAWCMSGYRATASSSCY